MKMTVLGNTGPYQHAGGACSGYLLEHNNSKILLDMGNGTLGNLLSICKIESLTAIFCSHLHSDHISDLFVLRYALQMKRMKLPLYIPSEPADEYQRLTSMEAFDVTPITSALTVALDGLTISFCEMQHPVLDFAIKITDGKSVFMYTGDTCECEALKAFVQGVHVLLCDCAFLEPTVSDIHLDMDKAIEIANAAGVRRLIMTHFNPEIEPQRYYQRGNDKFIGRLSKAELMSNFSI